MKITVLIAGVDDTNVSIKCRDARTALRFLANYDHEGASVDVIFEADAEEGYNLLTDMAVDNA